LCAKFSTKEHIHENCVQFGQRIPTPGGVMLRAKSYNPSFDPFDFKPDDQFEVFGRVLTVWRSQQM
jgi:hypothetical protein